MIDVISLIEANSISKPNEIALIAGKEVISYRHLNEFIDTLSAGLQHTLNVHQGDIIAFYANRNLDSILIVLSTLKIGATFLPIDPNLPVERVKEIVQLSRPKIFLELNESEREGTDIRTSNKICYLSKIRNIKTAPISVEHFDNEQLAYILFTSGSTGIPKGVKIQRKSLNNLIEWAIINIVKDKIIVAGLTRLTFDLSILDIFTALSSGGTFVMFSEKDLNSPANILRRIKLSRCNFIQTVPSLWDEGLKFLSMLEHSTALDIVKDIKTLILAGEQLHSKLLKKWTSFSTDDNEVINMYGPTETIHATYHRISKADIFKYEGYIPIGKPIDNIYIKILNDDNILTKDDEVGELHIGGISVSSGYISSTNNLNSREFYSEKSKNQFLNWYKTGDFVRQKGGQIFFVGRKDDQIKIAGHRIHLSDIENIALKNASIDKAVAVYTNILILFFTTESEEFSEIDVSQYLLKYFPVSLLPNKIIKISNIPINSNGKVDKTTLINSLEIKKGEGEKVFSISNDRLFFIEREKIGKNLIEHPQVTAIVSYEVNAIIILEALKHALKLHEIFRIQPHKLDDGTCIIIPAFSDYDLKNILIEIRLNGLEKNVLQRIVNSISENDIVFKRGPLFKLSFVTLNCNHSIISIRCHHAIASGTDVLEFTNSLCENLQIHHKKNLLFKSEIESSTLKWDKQVDNPKVVLNKKTFKINGELRGLIHLNENEYSYLKAYFSRKNSTLAQGFLCLHIRTLSEVYNSDVIKIESPMIRGDNVTQAKNMFTNPNVITVLPIEMAIHKYSNLFEMTLDKLLEEIINNIGTPNIIDNFKSNRWNYIPATKFITCKNVEEIIPFDLFEPLPVFSTSLQSSILLQEWRDEITFMIRFKNENFVQTYINKFLKNISLLSSNCQ